VIEATRIENTLPAPMIEVLPASIADEIEAALAASPQEITAEHAEAADAAAKELHRIVKAIEARRKELTAPINALKKAVDQVCATVGGPVEAERKALMGRIGSYMRRVEEERQAIIRAQEAEKRRQEEDARKAHEAEVARIKAEQAKLEAEAKAAELDDDIFAAPPPVIEPVKLPEPPKQVANPVAPPPVASSAVTFRTVYRLHIYDRAAIPASYFILNESKLMADLAAGLDVPGARRVADEIPVARGR